MNQLPNQNGEDDMSFVDLWRRAVFADATLNTTTKLVAMAIAEHADYATGRNAWPSNARLSEMCACSVRTVTTARKALASAGWIVAEDGTGRNGTTCCHLLLNEDQVEPVATPLANASTPLETVATPLANGDMVGSQMTTGGVEMVATNPSHTTTKKTKDREEEVDAERARDLQRGEVAPSLSTTTTQQDGGTGRHRSRQEQQAPVQHATSATSRLYGSDGEELEQQYRDAIRDGYSDGGRLMGPMQVGHWQLIERALMEKWTPEQLRADVAANVRDYVQRRIAVRPHMLVQDMGSRAEHRDPNAPRSDMDVSRDRLMEIFKKEGWA